MMGREDLRPVVRNVASAEIREQYLDAGKARRVLGWKPRHGMDEGLRRTIEWYRHSSGRGHQMTTRVFLGDLRYNYSGVLANDCMPLGVAYMKAVMDRDMSREIESRLFVYPDQLLEAIETRSAGRADAQQLRVERVR